MVIKGCSNVITTDRVVFQSRNTTLSNPWHTENWGKRCVLARTSVGEEGRPWYAVVRGVVEMVVLMIGAAVGEACEFWVPPAAIAYAGPDGGCAGFDANPL